MRGISLTGRAMIIAHVLMLAGLAFADTAATLARLAESGSGHESAKLDAAAHELQRALEQAWAAGWSSTRAFILDTAHSPSARRAALAAALRASGIEHTPDVLELARTLIRSLRAADGAAPYGVRGPERSSYLTRASADRLLIDDLLDASKQWPVEFDRERTQFLADVLACPPLELVQAKAIALLVRGEIPRNELGRIARDAVVSRSRSVGVPWELCAYLGADDLASLRKAVRDSLDTGDVHSGAFTVLASLGDAEILPDLGRGELRFPDHEPSFRAWRYMIEIQQSQATMLDFIAQAPGDQAWKDALRPLVIERAIARGVATEQVRDAILKHEQTVPAKCPYRAFSLPAIKATALRVGALKAGDLPNVPAPIHTE